MLFETSIPTPAPGITVANAFNGDTYKQLASFGIDRGSAFLSGAATSAFTKITAPGKAFSKEEADNYNMNLKGALHNKLPNEVINSKFIYELTEDLIYKYNVKLDGAMKKDKDGTNMDTVKSQHEELELSISYSYADGSYGPDKKSFPAGVINLYNSSLSGAKRAGDLNPMDPKNLYTNVMGAIGTTGALVNMGLEMFDGREELFYDILGSIISVIKEAYEKLLTKTIQKVTKITVSIPDKITFYTGYYFDKKLEEKPLSYIISQLIVENKGEEAAKKNEKKKNKQLEDMKKEGMDKIQKISKFVNNSMTFVSGKAIEAMRYIEEGPDFVIDNIDKYVNIGYEAAEEFVNKYIDDYEDAVKRKCEGVGQDIGTMLATKAINALETTVKILNGKENVAKSKARIAINKGAKILFLQIAQKYGLN